MKTVDQLLWPKLDAVWDPAEYECIDSLHPAEAATLNNRRNPKLTPQDWMEIYLGDIATIGRLPALKTYVVRFSPELEASPYFESVLRPAILSRRLELLERENAYNEEQRRSDLGTEQEIRNRSQNSEAVAGNRNGVVAKKEQVHGSHQTHIHGPVKEPGGVAGQK